MPSGYILILWLILQVKESIFKTLIVNGMFNEAHVRVTLSRGKKVQYTFDEVLSSVSCKSAT